MLRCADKAEGLAVNSVWGPIGGSKQMTVFTQRLHCAAVDKSLDTGTVPSGRKEEHGV